VLYLCGNSLSENILAFCLSHLNTCFAYARSELRSEHTLGLCLSHLNMCFTYARSELRCEYAWIVSLLSEHLLYIRSLGTQMRIRLDCVSIIWTRALHTLARNSDANMLGFCLSLLKTLALSHSHLSICCIYVAMITLGLETCFI
jgi:hypothetical protein